MKGNYMSDFHHISVTLEQILNKLHRLEMISVQKSKPFLNIDEASEYTGIPKQTLYQFTSKSRIPFHKLNDRRLYFSVEDLNEFILNKQNHHKSNDEIKTEALTRIATEK